MKIGGGYSPDSELTITRRAGLPKTLERITTYTYQCTSGGGTDTINVATGSLIDRLLFTELASTPVTFSRGGGGSYLNLIATLVRGRFVTVTNWFTATANRLDIVNFANRQVTATEIDSLVNGSGCP